MRRTSPAKVRERMAFLEPRVTLPALQGRNLVTRKPDAIEWLSTERGDPLLTTWPAGLGRTAMFAADLDGAWTRDWIAWRGLGPAARRHDQGARPAARVRRASLTVTAGDRRRLAGATDGLTRRARSRRSAGRRAVADSGGAVSGRHASASCRWPR